MTDHKTKRKSVREEDWFKNVPEYMGEIVVRITEAKDAAQDLMVKLDEREGRLDNREAELSNLATVLDDRGNALLSAVSDMKAFANQLYGPESELTRIHEKLASIEKSNTDRHTDHTRQLEAFEANQSRFREWVNDKFGEIDVRLSDFNQRLLELESARQSA